MTGTEIIASVRDQRAAQQCVEGARTWFTSHGLDYRTFCREGYPVSVLRATGDPLAEKVCRAAEMRVNREQSNREQSDG